MYQLFVRTIVQGFFFLTIKTFSLRTIPGKFVREEGEGSWSWKKCLSLSYKAPLIKGQTLLSDQAPMPQNVFFAEQTFFCSNLCSQPIKFEYFLI